MRGIRIHNIFLLYRRIQHLFLSAAVGQNDTFLQSIKICPKLVQVDNDNSKGKILFTKTRIPGKATIFCNIPN